MKIICLTEETVEFFHHIGRSDVIMAVSSYAVRPKELKGPELLPRVSLFNKANINKIVDMRPNLVIGYSDVQKDIAKDLVDQGVNVLITHQRSINEIFESMRLFGNLIGESIQTEIYLRKLEDHIQHIRLEAKKFKKRPKIYFEEWDEPLIGGSLWIHELIEIAGGESLFMERSKSSHKALQRAVLVEEVQAANPDIILFSWCGKKGKVDSILKRVGLEKIEAVIKRQVFELPSDIILQPGPAALTDGLNLLFKTIFDWNSTLS